jgi:AraC-like DNA-binding protein
VRRDSGIRTPDCLGVNRAPIMYIMLSCIPLTGHSFHSTATGRLARTARSIDDAGSPVSLDLLAGHARLYGPHMKVAELAHLRRARDMLDREYARPLNVPAMARAALMSPSLFSRRFREAYGDTAYGYLQTRRVERAMALLRRGNMSVTDVCMAVGFTSLGSFSSTFTRLVGEPPSAYRARDHSRLAPVPPCMTRAWARPRWIAEPCRIGEAFQADRA